MSKVDRARVALIAGLVTATVFAGIGSVQASARGGVVYTLSNKASGNAVVVLRRTVQGRLARVGRVGTGGQGSGAGLGSQGALVLDRAHHRLFAVNAGSDEISLLRAYGTHVALRDTVASGGDLPVSVTYHGRLVYVVNAGGNNISGFRIAGGSLVPIPGSRRMLSAPMAGPAQIGFAPNGRFLVVTEKNTNAVSVFQVGEHGKARPAIVNASEGQTPFGFAFDPRGRLIVSEAFGGAPDASAVSSYRIGAAGRLRTLEASARTTETAACWVVVAPNHFAYTTNTGSGSVSAFHIQRNGTLALRDADGVTGSTGTGSTPIDMDLTVHSKFLYVLNAGTHMIQGFRVDRDGGLEKVAGTGGFPVSTVGLIAD